MKLSEQQSKKQEFDYKNVAITACVLLFVLPMVFYFASFNDGFGDQSEFGSFGDFTNPFLSGINIILLIYIASNVKRYEDKRHVENIEAQKKLNFLMLQNEEYHDIVYFFVSLEEIDFTNFDIQKHENKVRNKLISFRMSNSSLFTLFKPLETEGIQVENPEGKRQADVLLMAYMENLKTSYNYLEHLNKLPTFNLTISAENGQKYNDALNQLRLSLQRDFI